MLFLWTDCPLRRKSLQADEFVIKQRLANMTLEERYEFFGFGK